MEAPRQKMSTEEWIYLVCYGIWFFLCCLYLSEWRRLYPISELRLYVSNVAYVLVLISFFCSGEKFSVKQFLFAAIFLTVAILSESVSGVKMTGATAAFIIAARNVDKRRILKLTFAIMLVSFLIIAGSVLLGFIPNLMEDEVGRERWRIGFIYTSYPSHMILFMTMILIAVSEKVNLLRTILLAGANFLIYRVTDTIADFAVALFLVAFAFGFSYIRQKELTDRLGPAFCALPAGLLVLSYLTQYFYNPESERWQAVNKLLHSRIALGHMMMTEKSHTLLGQSIKWVGATSKSKLPYNFVDNYYLHTGINQGILYLGFIILFFTAAMVRYKKTRSPLMLLAISTLLLHGLVDPQMGNLTWHPFVLLGCVLFENVKEAKNVIPIRQKVYL